MLGPGPLPSHRSDHGSLRMSFWTLHGPSMGVRGKIKGTAQFQRRICLMLEAKQALVALWFSLASLSLHLTARKLSGSKDRPRNMVDSFARCGPHNGGILQKVPKRIANNIPSLFEYLRHQRLCCFSSQAAFTSTINCSVCISGSK